MMGGVSGEHRGLLPVGAKICVIDVYSRSSGRPLPVPYTHVPRRPRKHRRHRRHERERDRLRGHGGSAARLLPSPLIELRRHDLLDASVVAELGGLEAVAVDVKVIDELKPTGQVISDDSSGDLGISRALWEATRLRSASDSIRSYFVRR